MCSILFPLQGRQPEEMCIRDSFHDNFVDACRTFEDILEVGNGVFAPEMIGLRVFLVNAESYRRIAQRTQRGQYIADDRRAGSLPLQVLVPVSYTHLSRFS